MPVVTVSRVCLVIALVLFLIATLSAAGAISGLSWALPGGLTAFAAAFLLP